MSDCLFCKIINKELPADVMYEDERFLVILDKFPAAFGHVLILPKAHYENIYDLGEAEQAAIMPLAAKLAKALKETLGLEGLNVLQNNGKLAGQVVFHYHLHLVPRADNDGVKIGWTPSGYDDDKIKGLISKIKDIL